MIIDFIIEDLMLNSYLQKNFHTLIKEFFNCNVSFPCKYPVSYIPGIHTPDSSTQQLSGVRVLAYMDPVEGSR